MKEEGFQLVKRIVGVPMFTEIVKRKAPTSIGDSLVRKISLGRFHFPRRINKNPVLDSIWVDFSSKVLVIGSVPVSDVQQKLVDCWHVLSKAVLVGLVG